MRLPGSQSLEAAHAAVVKESRFGGLLAPDVRRGGGSQIKLVKTNQRRKKKRAARLSEVRYN